MPAPLAAALADVVVALHFAFIVFAAGGALLVGRWPRLAWLHLPALAWGAWVMFSGGICPLTPLENALRAMAAQQGYAGGFIDRYLTALIYPEGLTRGVQIALGAALVAANVALYMRWLRRRRDRRTTRTPGGATPPA